MLPSPLAAGNPSYALPAGRTTAEWLAVLNSGAWIELTLTFLTACVAVGCLAAAFGGWVLRQCNLFERIVLGLAGFALLYADVRLDAIGGALMLIGIAAHLFRVRRAQAPASPETA